jgi:DnaK suppressor protein
MNDAELEDVRRDLLERRDELRARLNGLTARPERGANLSFGKRIGDGTTEAVARLNEIGVGRSLEASEARIERALAKLDEGTYGRCDNCGEPIGARRLAAAPDSTFCIECARSS